MATRRGSTTSEAALWARRQRMEDDDEDGMESLELSSSHQHLAWSWPADDYGSERFSAINQCFIDGSKHKGTDKGLEPSHLALIACMDRLGFEPCDDCQSLRRAWTKVRQG